jgi:hypothetical protein
MRSYVLALAVTAGCGLVDPDITHFQLYVQEKPFTVATEDWALGDVDAFTSIDCSESTGICAVSAEQACGEGECAGRCDGATDRCELQIIVALWQTVNIDMENPELRDIASEPVVDVEIDSIEYEVSENTLNVATPPMTLYVAPSTIMTWGGSEAHAIGTIEMVAAGTLVPRTEVVLTDEGRATLADYMGDYMTPFNIIVGSELVVGMGDTVPSGAMTATVQVRAHAGL